MKNKNNYIEDQRSGNIKTNYVLIHDDYVDMHIRELEKQGLEYKKDYFILGVGKYKQIHKII